MPKSRVRIEDAISVILLLTLLGTVFLQIFTRYVLGSPLPWTEELSRFQLIVLTFLAASIAVRRRSHMGLDFFVEMLPQPARKPVRLASTLATTAFYIWASWSAYQMMVVSTNRSLMTLPISRSALYGLVAAGFALMAWRSIADIRRAISDQEA